MDVREKLVELLANYFDIGDSYAYNLTRAKSAFACGTIGFDDFKEFDEETVEDIATHLIAHGVTVQEWISVTERLPEDASTVLAIDSDGTISSAYYVGRWHSGGDLDEDAVTYWMPLPTAPKEDK